MRAYNLITNKIYRSLNIIGFTKHHGKGAYIKYVGGGAGGFYKIFKKNFVAQETIDLNI